MSGELNRKLFYAASCGNTTDCENLLCDGGTVQNCLKFCLSFFLNLHNILLANVDWKNRDEGGATALIVACQNNRADVVDLLLSKGAGAAKKGRGIYL